MSVRNWIAAGLLALAAVTGGWAPAFAQSAAPSQSDPVADPDFSDLEPFVDGLMHAQLRATGAPGGVIAIVHRGRPLLVKGYGFADLARRMPVDGERSMFRIASISKLFVSTVVMRLAAAGKIDLEADIRTYLGDTIDRRFADPIRVRDLLTHRAGFQDARYGIFHPSGTSAPPLQDVIDATMPRQAFRPGQYPAYSNHGYILLGRIVERVTGTPYHAYVERTVLGPLGMRYASARQPVPGALRQYVVTGYDEVAGVPKSHPFEIVSASPGGAISASGAAMARFMAFAMGAEPRPDILPQAWLQRAQSLQRTSHPTVNGMGFGFVRQTLHGRPAWYHTGSLNQAFSRLTVLPGEQFGVFLAFNHGGAGGAITDPLDLLLDRYYPAPARSPLPSPPPAAAIAKYEGAYQTTGSHFLTPFAFSSARNQAVVTVVGPGVIEVAKGGTTTRWQWAGPDRFRQITGSDGGEFGDMVFVQAQGADRPTSFARLSQPTRDNVRMEGLGDIRVATAMLDWGWQVGAALAIVLLLIAGAAISARRGPGAAASLVSFAGLTVLWWFLSEVTGPSSGDAIGFGPDAATQRLLGMPYLAVVLGIAGVAIFAHAWRRGDWPRVSIAAIIALTLYWSGAITFLMRWNFLL